MGSIEPLCSSDAATVGAGRRHPHADPRHAARVRGADLRGPLLLHESAEAARARERRRRSRRVQRCAAEPRHHDRPEDHARAERPGLRRDDGAQHRGIDRDAQGTRHRRPGSRGPVHPGGPPARRRHGHRDRGDRSVHADAAAVGRQRRRARALRGEPEPQLRPVHGPVRRQRHRDRVVPDALHDVRDRERANARRSRRPSSRSSDPPARTATPRPAAEPHTSRRPSIQYATYQTAAT